MYLQYFKSIYYIGIQVYPMGSHFHSTKTVSATQHSRPDSVIRLNGTSAALGLGITLSAEHNTGRAPSSSTIILLLLSSTYYFA